MGRDPSMTTLDVLRGGAAHPGYQRQAHRPRARAYRDDTGGARRDHGCRHHALGATDQGVWLYRQLSQAKCPALRPLTSAGLSPCRRQRSMPTSKGASNRALSSYGLRRRACRCQGRVSACCSSSVWRTSSISSPPGSAVEPQELTFPVALDERSLASSPVSHCWLCTGAAVPHFTSYGLPDELLVAAANSMNCSVL